ncbi:MAG: hypothetical protein KAH48_05420 [Chlorobi bacterium]|nr:hypothetical protein [Chlorobiota bacterium]
MKKFILVLSLVFTAGFFACSELPTDIISADVEIVSSDKGSGSIAVVPQVNLISYTGGMGFIAAEEETIDPRKGTTISSYLNDCLSAKSLNNYIKCIKRKVKGLISKGFLSAEDGALIVAWAEEQPPIPTP